MLIFFLRSVTLWGGQIFFWAVETAGGCAVRKSYNFSTGFVVKAASRAAMAR
jgi:hypothetical protein